MRPRRPRRDRRGSRHGSRPSSPSTPAEGRNAVEMSRRRLVFPAPEGPMMAARSPRASPRLTSWMARWPPSSVSATDSSLSSKQRPGGGGVRLLQQSGGTRSVFDALVVFHPGRDELRGPLQLENAFVLRVFRIERKENLG